MFAEQQRLTTGISAFMEILHHQLELIISGVTTFCIRLNAFWHMLC
jgi:hypothetical protein